MLDAYSRAVTDVVEKVGLRCSHSTVATKGDPNFARIRAPARRTRERLGFIFTRTGFILDQQPRRHGADEIDVAMNDGRRSRRA
jgi:hypothetical protein